MQFKNYIYFALDAILFNGAETFCEMLVESIIRSISV